MISKKMKREKEILENFMSIKEVQEGFTYIYQTKYFTFENNEYKALVVLLSSCNDNAEKEVAIAYQYKDESYSYQAVLEGKVDCEVPADFETKIEHKEGSSYLMQVLQKDIERHKYIVYLNPQIRKVEELSLFKAATMDSLFEEHSGKTLAEYFEIK